MTRLFYRIKDKTYLDKQAFMDMANTVIDTIALAPGPLGIAFNSDGSKMYVNSFDSDRISVIDTATRMVIDTIVTGAAPVDLILAPAAPCPADFDGNGSVGASDLLALLANWGVCP